MIFVRLWQGTSEQRAFAPLLLHNQRLFTPGTFALPFSQRPSAFVFLLFLLILIFKNIYIF